MKSGEINLKSLGINQTEAHILRSSLVTFAEDWDSPEMSIYDNYDAAKNIKRGDVVLVVFPNSNLISAKTRPALIVQADHLQTDIPQVIVAMITSQMWRSGHPCRVSVFLRTLEGQQSGLLMDSVVMADNLATITIAAVSNIIDHFRQ